MAFTTTSTPPSTNPTVTVGIAGLLALESGPDDSCVINVHRLSRMHTFQVMLVVKKPNRPPRLIRLLTGPLTSDLNMSVADAATGFRVFASDTAADPFDRSANPPDDDELSLDYRWAFNARSLPDHEHVKVNAGGRPVATLNTGVLYTSTLTRPDLQIMQVCGGDETNLYRVAADMAIAIELEGESKFVITWSAFGEPDQRQELPRDGDPEGTTYGVVLLNDPPMVDAEAHDELKEYYKILRTENGSEIPEQCRLDVNPHKTDEIPCLAILLDP
ncbi:MAG TPA: hypothetical protein VFZ22_15530 [Pyrinomonadaceae bacterium]|nr:hypothetical protein [Pyrinomonadaceae bacterium]